MVKLIAFHDWMARVSAHDDHLRVVSMGLGYDHASTEVCRQSLPIAHGPAPHGLLNARANGRIVSKIEVVIEYSDCIKSHDVFLDFPARLLSGGQQLCQLRILLLDVGGQPGLLVPVRRPGEVLHHLIYV
jgi:hypothetical protein